MDITLQPQIQSPGHPAESRFNKQLLQGHREGHRDREDAAYSDRDDAILVDIRDGGRQAGMHHGDRRVSRCQTADDQLSVDLLPIA